jgi:hypothetical protein
MWDEGPNGEVEGNGLSVCSYVYVFILRSGDAKGCARALRLMKKNVPDPDAVCYSTVIFAALKCRDIDLLVIALREMEQVRVCARVRDGDGADICPHTATCVSSFCFIIVCVLICGYLSPYWYICVVILLHMCPHMRISVSSYCYICCTYVSSFCCICVLICGYVSSYCYICVRILLLLHVSSYRATCVRILPHMCPRNGRKQNRTTSHCH